MAVVNMEIKHTGGEHRMGEQLQSSLIGLADDGSVGLLFIDEDGTNGCIFARGSALPDDTSTGYAKGCIFILTGGSDESDTVYANIGSAASSNFNLVTVAGD